MSVNVGSSYSVRQGINAERCIKEADLLSRIKIKNVLLSFIT